MQVVGVIDLPSNNLFEDDTDPPTVRHAWFQTDEPSTKATSSTPAAHFMFNHSPAPPNPGLISTSLALPETATHTTWSLRSWSLLGFDLETWPKLLNSSC